MIKSDSGKLSDLIRNKVNELGYDLCGFIAADSFTEYKEAIKKRVKEFPKSEVLFNDLLDLAEPKDAMTDGKSIIVCVRRYGRYVIPEDLSKHIARLYIFDKRIEGTPLYEMDRKFEGFLQDNGIKSVKNAISSRLAAVKAGLGYIGRNNFLYTSFGSWVTIDTWIIDKQLEYYHGEPKVNGCIKGCEKCIQSCPTKALSAEYLMDMGKCIAELSYYPEEISESGLVPEELRCKMGEWMYGCDVCQLSCPVNRGKWTEEEVYPGNEWMIDFMKPENILTMSMEDYINRLQPRFSYIKPEALWIWKCNAITAIGNSNSKHLYECIVAASKDEDSRVREAARWAIEKINGL